MEHIGHSTFQTEYQNKLNLINWEYFEFSNMANIIILGFILTSTAYCQSIDTTYKYWMSAGFWIEEQRGITFEGDYTFSLDNNFYKVAYLYRGGLLGDMNADVGKYIFGSVNILAGKRLQSKWFQASLFCGPSYVYGSRGITGGFNEKFNTAGLDLQTQLIFRLANEIGIGIGLNGNLNFVKNFGDIFINITIGNGK